MSQGVGGAFREPVAEAPLRPRRRAGTRPTSCLVLAGCLLSAGCGSTLYLTTKATVPRPPAEVFDCVKTQVEALGYDKNSIDVRRMRLTVRKPNDETQVSDAQLQKNFDLLEIQVGKSPDGGAQLSVGAHSFARVSTGGGPWQSEVAASPAVKEAAQKLLEACGK